MALRRALLPMLSIVVAACASAKPVAPPPAPSAPPPAPARPAPEGRVGVSVVADAPSSPPEDTGTDFRPPVARGTLALPVYPVDALAAGATGQFVVRVLIDTEGKVSRIEDSPREPASTGPFAAAFRASVDAAVRTWSFIPGEIQYLRPGKDLDGNGEVDYQIVDSSAATPFQYDFRFEFSIVDGTPTVGTTGVGAAPAR